MPTKNHKAAQSTQRRWLAMNKQDDGTFQVLVMLADDPKPLATIVVEAKEFKRLADTANGLLKK